MFTPDVVSIADTARLVVHPCGLCSEIESPCETVAVIHSSGRVPFTYGIPGIPRNALPGYDSGVVCMLLVTFLLITLNFRHRSTFIKSFAQDLLSVRRRSNVFEDHTLSETGILLSLVILLCVSEGLLLFTAFHPSVAFWGGVSGSVAVMMLLAGAFYLWQLGIYTVGGYVFADKVYGRQWVRGFNASQALLGLALAAPALAVTYRPGTWIWVAPLCIMLYLTSRIIFICKGFRIFYSNYFSLVYFIVYLCALEIVPLIVIVRVCRFLEAF